MAVMLKAIAAFLAPLVVNLAGQAGLTESTPGTIETGITAVLSFVLIYFVPNFVKGNDDD